jgi:hypothetical protein
MTLTLSILVRDAHRSAPLPVPGDVDARAIAILDPGSALYRWLTMITRLIPPSYHVTHIRTVLIQRIGFRHNMCPEARRSGRGTSILSRFELIVILAE